MKTAIQYDNSPVVDSLQHYCTLYEALEFYPALSNILTGVSLLDYGGNTRPLSTKMLYTLLSTLPVISTAAVIGATGYSVSHAKRLCVALRVASKALMSSGNIQATDDRYYGAWWIDGKEYRFKWGVHSNG